MKKIELFVDVENNLVCVCVFVREVRACVRARVCVCLCVCVCVCVCVDGWVAWGIQSGGVSSSIGFNRLFLHYILLLQNNFFIMP
jgi:hypothetical protein